MFLLSLSAASSAEFFAALVAVYFAILLAECGDKTQLAALVLASGKGRSGKLAVFVGASVALVICSVIATFAGGLASKYLPELVRLPLAAALFLFFGYRILKGGEDDDEESNGKSKSRDGFWGLLGSSLATVFVNEMGDKTQFGTAGAAAANDWLPVLLGSSAALMTSTALAVLLSGALEKVISPTKLVKVGGWLFIGFGVYYLVLVVRLLINS